MNPDKREAERQFKRGSVLECGKCQVSLSWNPLAEEYKCPDCGWIKGEL